MHALSITLWLPLIINCSALIGTATTKVPNSLLQSSKGKEGTLSPRSTTIAASKSKSRSTERLDRLSQRIEPREICRGCNRPLIQCLCDHVPSTKINLHTEVICLQHPVEFRRKTISTVPLLKLVLQNCRVMVGRSFEQELEIVIDDACDRGMIPLLLFPGPDAITLEDSDAMYKLRLAGEQLLGTTSEINITGSVDSKSSDTLNGNKYLLIIVDGTWTQAKRMARYSPVLMKRCQPIQFMGTSDRSIYDSIRKQPESFCLSTLESCARTLKLLEPDNPLMDEAVDHLHAALKALVRTQMEQERMHLESSPESIRNSTKLDWKRKRQDELEGKLNFDKETNDVVSPINFVGLNEERDLGDGYSLRSLQGSNDAKFVDSRWPYSSSKSLRMIERQIEADNKNATKTNCSCCLGIEYRNELVGCILRHRNGSLGILHIDENHRRRGFGDALLKEASRAVIHRKQPLFAYIVDGNNQSEALFFKQGWVKADPDSIKGTGKRKAKRLWLFKS